MQRFVYSPKVFIYVNTGGAVGDKNNPPKIVDLTNYTTAGSVNRVISQVSTAEITIRNPHKKWTQPGNPTFRPMDPITIFMQRQKGFPVQVFTGYLDRTPYYHLYPGTCTLMASCTLKRLLHKYFDPALNFTFNFLGKYGWKPAGAGGGLTNIAEETQSAGLGTDSKKVTVVGDSLAVGAAGPLRDALGGYQVSSDALTGRTTQQGITALKAKPLASLPGTVVISLGTNDDPGNPSAFRTRVREIMTYVGEKRHVVWVNLRGAGLGGSLAPLNQVLTQESRRYENLTILNWNRQVTEQNIEMTGVHTNPEGYTKRAKAIANAVKRGGGRVPSQNEVAADIIDDTGFGRLLYAVMTEIGDWRSNEIYIEELPIGITDKVARLYRSFEDDNSEAAKDFNTLLRKLIGTSSQGTGGGNENVDSQATLYTGPLDRDFRRSTPGNFATETISFQDAAMLAEMAGLPGITYAQIARGESGLRPGADGGVEGTPGAPGFGLWQMTPGAQNEATRRKWESIGNYFNPWKNALMAKHLAGSGTGVSNYYGTGFVTDVNKRYTGPMPKSRLTEGVDDKDEETDNSSGTGNPAMGGNGGRRPAADAVEDAGGGTASAKVRTPKELIDQIVLPLARQNGVNKSVAENDAANDRHSLLSSSGNRSDHKGPPDKAWAADLPAEGAKGDKLATALAKRFRFDGNGIGSYVRETIDGFSIQILRNVEGHFSHVHVGVQKVGAGEISVEPGEGDSGGGGGGSGGGDEGGSDSGNEKSPFAAAFAAVLDWPSIAEQSEARRLYGQKSLMNDKPLLPFIEQLAGASLRSFQSLPNGAFFAFYPDYFGEMGHRTPYWAIDDVEILDGAIELTDDALVTHQYVVGDTIWGNGIRIEEKVASGGVVTVFNAFGTPAGTDGEPLVPQFDGKAGADAALAFLQKYGPRPDYHEAPMIRNPYFEMFLAYQKFMLSWSKQFATNFTFTFMPELYPGGRVAFTNHGLQCYIDSVTHNWDYSSGFTTSAVLSAPSAFGGKGKTLQYSSGLVRETDAGEIFVPNERN